MKSLLVLTTALTIGCTACAGKHPGEPKAPKTALQCSVLGGLFWTVNEPREIQCVITGPLPEGAVALTGELSRDTEGGEQLITESNPAQRVYRFRTELKQHYYELITGTGKINPHDPRTEILRPDDPSVPMEEWDQNQLGEGFEFTFKLYESHGVDPADGRLEVGRMLGRSVLHGLLQCPRCVV